MLRKTKQGFYILPRLARVAGLIHGFSPVSFGNMSSVYSADALTNRVQFCRALELNPASLFSINQKHTKKILILRNLLSINRKKNLEADGMITKQKQIGLLIKTADCLPLLLVEPQKKVIGLAHAGRLGIKLGIHLAILEAMEKEFQCQSANLLIGFGPAICGCCYHAKIDLEGIVLADFKKQGIKPEQVERSGVCAFENLDFYSHQRGVATGEPEARFATILAWKS